MYLSDLNSTWTTWTRRDGRRAIRRWQTTADLETVTIDRLTARGRTLVDDPNFQRTLLDTHAPGDDDAGLVVLWLLAPGLVNLRRSDGPNSALGDGDLIGLVWCHIARYDPPTRAGLSVPNLLRDIRRDWIRARRKPAPTAQNSPTPDPVQTTDRMGSTICRFAARRTAPPWRPKWSSV